MTGTHIATLPNEAFGEIEEIGRKFGYIDLESISNHYISYIQMQANALYDLVGPEVTKEYILMRGLPPELVHAIGIKSDSDDFIRCEEIKNKLREEIKITTYVPLRDYYILEAARLRELGIEDSKNPNVAEMQKLEEPRSHLRREYLEMDIETRRRT